MVLQINSIHLSIERKIVTFPTAKQFAVLLVFLTCNLVSFFPDIAFFQTKLEPSATLDNLEDNRVDLAPEEQAWLEAHPDILNIHPEHADNLRICHAGFTITASIF